MNTLRENNKCWITITEYSIYHSISISTIRRKIKSREIEFKQESGKYLLLRDSVAKTKKDKMSRIQTLEKQLQDARQEIYDLKMLINLMEDSCSDDSSKNSALFSTKQ